MELPLVTTRTCGPCSACCVSYPLLPIEEFWPDGKPAHAPCKFLCESRCGIHDRARPPVCTEYECAYIKGVVPQRPSECGVLFTCTRVQLLFQGQPPEQLPPDGCGGFDPPQPPEPFDPAGAPAPPALLFTLPLRTVSGCTTVESVPLDG